MGVMAPRTLVAATVVPVCRSVSIIADATAVAVAVVVAAVLVLMPVVQSNHTHNTRDVWDFSES